MLKVKEEHKGTKNRQRCRRHTRKERKKEITSIRNFNMEDIQSMSFKIWMLNYLEQKCLPVAFSELSDDFDKVSNSVHGLDNLNQRLTVSSFTDLLEQDFNGLIKLDEDGKFIILEYGKTVLSNLLNNCRKCSISGDGYCLLHAVENLITWTAGPPSDNKHSSNDNKELSDHSRSSTYDENYSTQNSSKEQYNRIKKQCQAFKVWFFNLLSVNEGLNIDQIGNKFSKEIKKVNWLEQFGYPKLSTFIEREMHSLVSLQEDKYKITNLGKSMLDLWLNSCDVCKPSASAFYGFCTKHALNILRQFTQLRNDSVPLPVESAPSFYLVVSFKVWLLDLLQKQPKPISFTNVQIQLENIHGKKIDSFLMFKVKDISELIYSQLVVGLEYIVIEKDALLLTSKGKSHMMFLINNCFFCKNGNLQGVCFSHALDSLKNLSHQEKNTVNDVECNIAHQNSPKVSENLKMSYSNLLRTINTGFSHNGDEKIHGISTPLMKHNSSSLLDTSFKGPPLFQKPPNNLTEFPTLAESKNISSRYTVPSQKPMVPLNIRPLSELQEYEILEIPKITKVPQKLTHQHINSITLDCIQQLAESKQHVSLQKIVSHLLNRFQVKSLNMLNQSIKKPEHIECIFKHSRDLCRINCYIQAYVTVHSVATAYELYECLKEYDYDNLQLGPFIRLPILYDYFKIPNDLTVIPRIETKDIILSFKNYLSENNKWLEKVDLPEFLNYLTKQYNAVDCYHLGVQIKSLALILQVVKKCQRDEKDRRRTLTDEMNKMLDMEITGYIDSYRRHLLKCTDNLNKTKHLGTRPLNQVLNNFLETYELMVNGLLDERIKINCKNHIKKIRLALKSDPLVTSLFSLAICCSFDGRENEILERVNKFYQESIDSPNKKSKEEKAKNLPSQSEVIAIIKDYLERILEKGQLTLKHLSQIETKLSEKFEIPFDNLGCGTFLECLVQQPKLLQMLDEAGCSSLGLSSSGGDSKNHYLPSFPDVLSFLHQCDKSLSQDILAAVLCQYYGVSDIKALNYGSLNRLLESDNQQRSFYNIFYETAITTSGSIPLLSKKTVGYLGSKSPEEALNCLENCPLLEDLINWSHWEFVFQPELGDIKAFIKKYGQGGRHGGIRRQPLLVMEVQPGKLLKLTNDASDELFSNAACAGDIQNTCGHLVSLIALNGVKNSLALWSTRIKIALSNIYEKESERNDPEKNPDLVVCRFVIGCLQLIPRKICHAIAEKVFLEPLSSLGGSQSKQLLLQCCFNSEEVGLLQELGMVLVIQEWVDSFNNRIKLNQPSIINIPSEFKESSQEESSDDGPSELSYSESEDNESDESILDSLSDDNDKTLAVSEDFSKRPEISSSESMDMAETSKENEKVKLNDSCLLVIDTIRKEEFGVGLELDGDAAALLRCHEERLGRSLDRLSKDLYSKDTHFVLELIQNADDNTYPPEYFEKDVKIEPAIKFVLQNDKIIILNNECGFLEKHIRALCDVGKSTKGKHVAGYIGQKGIGFKSVFRISNQPEIHSAGFHFRFDVTSGPMGYIMPHWIEDTDPQESWTTKIQLPLKDEFQTTMHQRCLLAQFEDIHSSLLIFLHRLRSISIVNEVENKYIEMKRKDLSPNLIELNCSDSKCQWLVIRKKLDASKISTQMKAHGGVDVVGTELALAFPLVTGNEKKTNLKIMPPKQKVFAFLPLRSYGFRFILQADFEVPSSREDIDTDSPWNQWLRNEVHVLFCEALQHFKDLPTLNSVEAVCYFLQFVPFEDEILDFFRPVTSGIHKLLSGKPCIPVINGEKSVDWKIPVQVVIPVDSLIQEVIPPSLIKQTLDLYYIHPLVIKNVSPTLLTSLGVQKLDTSHLISIGITLASDLQKNNDNSEVVGSIFNWLICLYRSLDDIHLDSILDPIKTIPIIPLANGQLVTISDNCIFFPVKRKNQLAPDQEIISLIEKELNVVHSDLINCTDDIQRSQVVKLLEIIGVKHSVPKEIISGHIIPAFQSDSWKDKSQDTLVAYVVYIKQQSDRTSHVINLDELKGIIQLLTNHGLKNPLQESIHFTKDYANSIDLQKQLEGFQWTLLDRCYLKFSSSFDDKLKDDLMEWRNFFSKLGVLDSLGIKLCSVTHTPKTLKSSHWSSICDRWPVSEKYIIKDFVSDQFLALTSKNECPLSRHKQMTTLVELIDRDWNNHFIKMITADVCNEDGNVICQTESSFSLSLKHLPWLPGEQCTIEVLDDKIVKESIKKDFWPACELFKSSDEFKKLLSVHVPYLMASLSSHSSFGQYLGLKGFVNLNLIKNLLISWCTRKEDTAVSFITSLSHMSDIYNYLWSCSNPIDLTEIFANYPIIFVPNSQTYNSKNLICGKFLTSKEVFWNEPSGVFFKYCKHFQIINLRRNLSSYYPKLDRIFLEYALVNQHPNIDEYIAVLDCMSDIGGQVQTIIPDVIKLYLVIHDKFIITNGAALADVKASLSGHQIFPTTAGLWVSLEDKPMIADNKELVKLFQDVEGVYLLDFTQPRDKRSLDAQDSDQEAVLAFFKACGIEKLSECVTSISETVYFQPCPNMQKFFHDVIPYIQIFLWNKLPNIYKDLKLKSITLQLKQLCFAQASELYLKYTLKLMPSVMVKQDVKSSLVDGQLFIQEKYKENYHIIYNHLVSFFIRGHPESATQLRLFISGLAPVIHGQSKETISEFMESQNFEDLPADEELWSVPIPLILPIIYPVLPPEQKINKPEFTGEKGLTCFPPQAPKKGSSSNKTEESTHWPRVPTPPPDHIQIMQYNVTKESLLSNKTGNLDNRDNITMNHDEGAKENLSSNKTGNPNSREVNENLHTTNNTHRNFESLNNNCPSIRNSDISDQDTESANSCKQIKQLDNDMVEINDNERKSFKRQMHDNERKEFASVGKRLIRSSSLPNRRENFPHHDDSFVNCADKENFYKKIYHPRPTNRDHPINETEVEFEELGSGKNLVVPKTFETSQLVDRSTIGRYGEALVYDFLQASHFYPHTDIKISKIDWMNKEGESEYPFDLRVSLENAIDIFIEVKTTISDVKEVFEISFQEVQFAQTKKDAYHLFRVYNAGNNDKKRLVFLRDLASKLENQSVKLCMVI